MGTFTAKQFYRRFGLNKKQLGEPLRGKMVVTKFVRKGCQAEDCGGEVRMDGREDPVCLKCGMVQSFDLGDPPPNNELRDSVKIFMKSCRA